MVRGESWTSSPSKRSRSGSLALRGIRSRDDDLERRPSFGDSQQAAGHVALDLDVAVSDRRQLSAPGADIGRSVGSKAYRVQTYLTFFGR